MSRRLTQKDWRLIASALNDAMDERDSFADAYSRQGPEAEAAMERVREYETLHVKIFGKSSARAQQHAEYAAMESVPLVEIWKRNS